MYTKLSILTSSFLHSMLITWVTLWREGISASMGTVKQMEGAMPNCNFSNPPPCIIDTRIIYMLTSLMSFMFVQHFLF